MPAISASSAPRDAAAAPTRTTGVRASQVPATDGVASGAAMSAMRCGPRVSSSGDGHDRVDADRQPERERDGPRDRPLRIAHLLAEGGDPRVPAKAKNSRPADCSTP